MNAIIGNDAVDPISGSVPFKSYLCQVALLTKAEFADRSWADDNLLERRHRFGAVVDGRADLVERIGV